MAEANTAVHGENQVERRLVRPREIAAYALTSYGLNNLTTYVGSTKQYFMMSFLGLSGTAYGTLSTIATVWDALDDPISGIIIDRCRTLLGQAAPVFDIPHAVFRRYRQYCFISCRMPSPRRRASSMRLSRR